MASHALIDTYLADLAAHLPRDAVDELADGLGETFRDHQRRGLAAAEAAHAAIVEFGTSEQVIAAFIQHSPGRRVARLLLATGPAVGAAWGATLGSAHFWTWPVPTAAILAVGATLGATVALLVLAATSRHSYRRTRLAAVASVTMILLDLTMLAAIVHLTPSFVWPMALAIPASLARVGLTAHYLPHVATTRP